MLVHCAKHARRSWPSTLPVNATREASPAPQSAARIFRDNETHLRRQFLARTLQYALRQAHRRRPHSSPQLPLAKQKSGRLAHVRLGDERSPGPPSCHARCISRSSRQGLYAPIARAQTGTNRLQANPRSRALHRLAPVPIHRRPPPNRRAQRPITLDLRARNHKHPRVRPETLHRAQSASSPARMTPPLTSSRSVVSCPAAYLGT